MEDMVHAFDLMVADRYAGDGVISRSGPRHDKWGATAQRQAGMATSMASPRTRTG